MQSNIQTFWSRRKTRKLIDGREAQELDNHKVVDRNKMSANGKLLIWKQDKHIGTDANKNFIGNPDDDRLKYQMSLKNSIRN